MIKEIQIANCASYSPEGQCLSDCKEINYIFGANGSGKTTISRVIAGIKACGDSSITWKAGEKLECLVYNTDFVKHNFASEIPGIFTLGEENVNVLTKINQAKKEQEKNKQERDRLLRTLGGEDEKGGKKGERDKLRKEFEEDCWDWKDKHNEHFRIVFQGFHSSKEKFCDEILKKYSKNSSKVTPDEIEVLKNKVSTLFQKELERAESIVLPSPTDLMDLEKRPILTKKIVGKEDVDIAALILKLNNSDWVGTGRDYLAVSDPQCPFCQQSIPKSLKDDLNAFFDDAYTADIKALDDFYTSYESLSKQYLEQVRTIFKFNSEFIDDTALRLARDKLSQCVKDNQRRIESKKKGPSNEVKLESLASVCETISAIIGDANTKIKERNDIVKNLESEKKALTERVWRYVLGELKDGIAKYKTATKDLQKAVDNLTKQVEEITDELASIKGKIETLGQSITSIKPTVDNINKTLKSFGFSGFELATKNEATNQYKIVRTNGSDAATTLSEGERNFIIFLYFYHLIDGSHSESDTNTDRIVVFDDPVSSLDSDALFIVSSLIREVVYKVTTKDKVIKKKEHVKQVFVLTHNIYFHKEVAYDYKRSIDKCRKHEAFWIVRKPKINSDIEPCRANPIKTSYGLLWSEMNDKNCSNLMIQNMMRRILEYYFKDLGNINKDSILSNFKEKDKIICNALYSWMDAGSHTISDDLSVSTDNQTIEKYRKVFCQIFEKTGHINHYRMMMGDEAA